MLLSKIIINQDGQGLVEVLASLAIAMIVLTALTVASVTSIKNANLAKNTSQANSLAKQGMDSVRAYRDANPTALFSPAKQDGCYKINTSDPTSLTDNFVGMYTCGTAAAQDVIAGTPYTREVALDMNPAECPTPSGVSTNTCAKITVTIYWTDSTGTHKSTQDSLFGSWDRGISQ